MKDVGSWRNLPYPEIKHGKYNNSIIMNSEIKMQLLQWMKNLGGPKKKWRTKIYLFKRILIFIIDTIILKDFFDDFRTSIYTQLWNLMLRNNRISCVLIRLYRRSSFCYHWYDVSQQNLEHLFIAIVNYVGSFAKKHMPHMIQ